MFTKKNKKTKRLRRAGRKRENEMEKEDGKREQIEDSTIKSVEFKPLSENHADDYTTQQIKMFQKIHERK
jgi:hypothetical protein